MKFNKGSIGFLCLVWAFYLVVGGTLSLSIPFVLMIIGTALYLFM